MLRNITLSVEDTLIAKARLKAQQNQSTLNAVFRTWIKDYVGEVDGQQEYDALMANLGHVSFDGPYSREDMNER